MTMNHFFKLFAASSLFASAGAFAQAAAPTPPVAGGLDGAVLSFNLAFNSVAANLSAATAFLFGVMFFLELFFFFKTQLEQGQSMQGYTTGLGRRILTALVIWWFIQNNVLHSLHSILIHLLDSGGTKMTLPSPSTFAANALPMIGAAFMAPLNAILSLEPKAGAAGLGITTLGPFLAAWGAFSLAMLLAIPAAILMGIGMAIATFLLIIELTMLQLETTMALALGYMFFAGSVSSFTKNYGQASINYIVNLALKTLFTAILLYGMYDYIAGDAITRLATEVTHSFPDSALIKSDDGTTTGVVYTAVSVSAYLHLVMQTVAATSVTILLTAILVLMIKRIPSLVSALTSGGPALGQGAAFSEASAGQSLATGAGNAAGGVKDAFRSDASGGGGLATGGTSGGMAKALATGVAGGGGGTPGIDAAGGGLAKAAATGAAAVASGGATAGAQAAAGAAEAGVGKALETGASIASSAAKPGVDAAGGRSAITGDAGPGAGGAQPSGERDGERGTTALANNPPTTEALVKQLGEAVSGALTSHAEKQAAAGAGSESERRRSQGWSNAGRGLNEMMQGLKGDEKGGGGASVNIDYRGD